MSVEQEEAHYMLFGEAANNRNIRMYGSAAFAHRLKNMQSNKFHDRVEKRVYIWNDKRMCCV